MHPTAAPGPLPLKLALLLERLQIDLLGLLTKNTRNREIEFWTHKVAKHNLNVK